ncbi:hypothetical protein M0R72_07540 [Candidatus Pacearchaeota archaeon]|jgi:hypothetical protein|nr:hypothetical protein [Candidatus Pacearchaeota archaeon]
MKTNQELGYMQIAHVGSYDVGRKGSQYRAHGYEWHSEQAACSEHAHHEVCGRGDTPDEAIDRMIEMAIVSGRKDEFHAGYRYSHSLPGLSRDEAETLRRKLKEAVAEVEDSVAE